MKNSALTLILLTTWFLVCSGQWSNWSDWSPCSRSCNGGVSFRRRHCFNPDLCKGNDRQDKICNMDPCPDPKDSFRTQQCSEYNDVPYEGQMYTWQAAEAKHMTSERICSLVCQANEDPSVIVEMKSRVRDGTRCREDSSLDMCIEGTCRRIGCDLKLDSNLEIDRCGVCGGTGTSCLEIKSTFIWREVPISKCSAPCGGGQMMANAICINNVTKSQVEEDLCDATKKPDPRMAPCNTKPCPPRWEVDDWSICSKSCGGGIRFRKVACVIDKDGKKLKVSRKRCINQMPSTSEICNQEACPRWYAGIWSKCSVRCGVSGVQHRNVICRDASGYPSNACDIEHKPVNTQPCRGEGYGDPNCKEEQDVRERKGVRNNGDKDASWNENFSGQHKRRDGDDGAGISSIPSSDNGSNTSYRLLDNTMPLTPQKLTDSKPRVGAEPSFITEDWGRCSAKCGEGIRRRKVECKIFLEFSKTVATLPDDKCPGPKPEETQICFAGLCDNSQSANGDRSSNRHDEKVPALVPPNPEALSMDIQHDALSSSYYQSSNSLEVTAYEGDQKPVYKWKEAGFTECSESCLGGTQESKIICVDVNLGTAVSPVNCPISSMPEVIVRTCNDHPCPPRWNVSEFSQCSKSCGGGTQTRTVTCIQEVRHGASNVLHVDDSFCPQPPPIKQQFCNVIDCPIEWKTTEWTKCSRPCGGGTKYRKVHCQQLLALGSIAEKPDNECPKYRPQTESSCNDHACSSYDYERSYEPTQIRTMKINSGKKSIVIKAKRNQNYIQEPSENRVRLKIGGKARLIKGSKLVVRCPVKNFDRARIHWTFNGLLIQSKKSFRKSKRKEPFVNKKGVLRIKRLSSTHSGLYSCVADDSRASMEIMVVDKDTISNEVFNPLGSSYDDPVRKLNGIHSPDEEHGRDANVVKGSQSIYGVVKHMTDNPHSFDVYSYGKIRETTQSITHEPTVPPESDRHNWHIFSRTHKNSWNSLGATESPYDDQDTTPQHNMHMRFNTKLQGGRLTNKVKTDGDLKEKEEAERNENHETFWQNLEDFEADYPNEDADFDDDDNDSSSASGTSSAKVLRSSASVIFTLLLTILTFTSQISNQDEKEEKNENLNVIKDESEDEEESNEIQMSLDWRISDWSRCSHSCGTEGKQVREVECVVRKISQSDKQTTKEEVIPKYLCIDSGLVIPESVRSCEQVECPQWIVSRWEPCEESPCSEKFTALQKRSVTCGRLESKEVLGEKFCEAVLKPKEVRFCSNPLCVGIWKGGNWTECSKSCGSGMQTRSLNCVWAKSGSPILNVSNLCPEIPEREETRSCNNEPCPTTTTTTTTTSTTTGLSSNKSSSPSSCVDTSKYCGLVKSFRMCHIPKYQKQCCRSCKLG